MFVLLGPTLIMEKGKIMRSNIQTVYKAASVLGILGGSAVALHAILTRNEKQRLKPPGHRQSAGRKHSRDCVTFAFTVGLIGGGRLSAA